MYGGKKIRQLRQHLGLTQGDFATELNISQPYYSAIESGKKQITQKITDVIYQKWKVDKGYFESSSTKLIHEYMGVSNGGIDRGNINNLDEKSYISHLKEMILKSYPKMNFVYKSVEDLQITHPQLMDLQYRISELSALLVDAESIYKTYLEDALNANIKAENYGEYKDRLIKHLEKYAKYQPVIMPFLESLRKFVTVDFAEYDTKKVIVSNVE